jgi:hypothetical protein
MVGRIPTAIVQAGVYIAANVPGAVVSGISNPKYDGAFGYHHSRNHLLQYGAGWADKSMQHPWDKMGAADACSALDISLGTTQMKICTKRLIDAMVANDPRARALVEVAGTVNGTSTIAYDEKDGPHYEWGWDSTHMWHIHNSFWRRYADDAAALMDFARLFAGTTLEEPDMYPDSVKIPAATVDVTLQPQGQTVNPSSGDLEGFHMRRVGEIHKDLKAVLALLGAQQNVVILNEEQMATLANQITTAVVAADNSLTEADLPAIKEQVKQAFREGTGLA